MLVGYNEDVVVEGITYHVQSEDRGVKNPLLETLVYSGGTILHQEKHSYEELVEDGEVDQKVLARRLEKQHKDLLRRARHGEFAPEGARTLGDLIPADGPLEEVLDAFLRDDPEVELLRLVWKPDRNVPKVRGVLHVMLDGKDLPVPEALCEVRAVRADGSPSTLADGESGPDGTFRVDVDMPWAGLVALVFRAERGPGGGRLRVPLAAPKGAVESGALSGVVS